MLLAAAKALAAAGGLLRDTQPDLPAAEEYRTSDCGAVRMMNDGLFKYPMRRYLQHAQHARWPQGHLIFREGPMMASSDKVYITLVGHGGHGAVPHKAADPVAAAASLVMAL